MLTLETISEGSYIGVNSFTFRFLFTLSLKKWISLMRVVLIFIVTLTVVLGLSHVVWLISGLGPTSPLIAVAFGGAELAVWVWSKIQGVLILALLFACLAAMFATLYWGVIRLFFGISHRKARMHSRTIDSAIIITTFIAMCVIAITVVTPSPALRAGIGLSLLASIVLAGLIRITLMPHKAYAQAE